MMNVKFQTLSLTPRFQTGRTAEECTCSQFLTQGSEDRTTANRDENIVDECKVTSNTQQIALSPRSARSSWWKAKLSQSEIDWTVQETEKFRNEDEANESKYEAENGLEKSRVAVCKTLI